MNSDGFADRRVWITGASSGLGHALAAELGRRGARVAISGWNESALRELAGQFEPNRVLVVPFDATDRKANRDAAALIGARWGALELAVFNAGTAEYVDVARFDADVFERQMRTNFLSMVYGIESALPLLRMSQPARIVGVSSLSAYRGLPRAEAYGASKAAIRNMLESLRLDLAPEGVGVSVAMPGFVRTPLTGRNDFPMPFLWEAERAARRIADGLERDEDEIRFPWQLALPLSLVRLLPERWIAGVLGRMVRPSGAGSAA